jgi:hypothetical protein
MTKQYAYEYFKKYEETDVEIVEMETSNGVTIIETSDGKFWFRDSNDTCEIAEWIDPDDVIHDERNGYINVNFK